MKNLESLSQAELRAIAGGCQFGDCGEHPIIIIIPTLPPTFPEEEVLF